MAKDTPEHCRNLVLYEIYVRNHGPNGTFDDVEADLARIRSMGVDVVWFMPMHPIGMMNKKGSLGSPYSIADYREVNPDYGTRADLARLIERAHSLELKVMIDVVYNHTAHDSVLLQEYPEWFHQDARGKPVTTVPEWSDVIDLKHPNRALTEYLIDTLQMWVAFGVDGFRCDVASLLPLNFWLWAREAVAEVKSGVIWLAESVQANWVAERRTAGLPTLSDSQLYRAFDLTYDYDIWLLWQAAVVGKVPAARYLEMLRFQDCIYPENYVKMRCVENHDQPRIMALAPGREQALAWTAFQAFNKGAFLIYAGQEAGAPHTPSLFDVDKVAWGDYALQPFLTRLAQLKKDPAQMEDQFVLLDAQPEIQATWIHPDEGLYGVFNVRASTGDVAVRLPDGVYTDLLSEEPVEVRVGRMSLPESAVIVRCHGEIDDRPFYSVLLDDYPDQSKGDERSI
jgi:glycosidase